MVLSYQVDPAVLAPRVPAGTELDELDGQVFVSLVGFLFLQTRVLGVPIPGHRDFEEVNLRFYVRRRTAEGWRRGVTFIRELVPRRAVALVARLAYGEPYARVPMAHELRRDGAPGDGERDGAVRPVRGAAYAWRHRGRPYRLAAEASGPLAPVGEDAEASFLVDRAWGYTAARDGGAIEYAVEHPAWNASPARGARFEGDAAALYGRELGPFLDRAPASALFVDGSSVLVRRGCRLEETAA